MIAFPNAKINLGLFVTSKRIDGYHDIETLMYPIPLCDVLEMIPAPDGKNFFDCTGLSVCDDPYSNLSFKAWLLMQETYKLPNVHIHLHKAIPSGAGLGGGSADAAFTIRLADKLFDLGLPGETMQQLAAQLGMDCPFFINNTPVVAFGRGDSFNASSIDLAGKYLMIVKPPFHIQTKAAYAAILPSPANISIAEIISQPIQNWKANLRNDFASIVLEKFPEAKKIVPGLYTLGAEYAAMSGSGSAFYGIFDHEVSCKDIFDPWFCRSFKLTQPKELQFKP